MKSSTSLAKAVSVSDVYGKLGALTNDSTAYGVVYRARELGTSKIVALKQVRISPEEAQNGVPITALREIAILRSLKHNNIVNVLNVAVEEATMDEIYMVMEYAEQVGVPVWKVFA